jgi:uncharacterized membrane protein YdbT with pleckstrin-like domain
VDFGLNWLWLLALVPILAVWRATAAVRRAACQSASNFAP